MKHIVRTFFGLCLFGVLVIFISLQIDLRQKYIQPSLEALFLHNTELFVEEYTKKPPKYSCPSNVSRNRVEDILCLENNTFLKNFKNPCWYEPSGRKQNSSSSVQNKILRCLPYFHIFGVCKTGTTDLFFRLIQHPQILPNAGVLGKETWFWSWRRYGEYTDGFTKVTVKQFTRAFNAKEIGETKMSIEDGSQYSDLITGHGDPMDFWDHKFWRDIHQNDPYENVPKVMTPHLVKHVQPNIKLILLLREPAERLYSHYYHGGYGRTPEEFHHDVISGIHLLNECVERSSYRGCLYGHNLTTTLPLPLSASLYYIHLQEWMSVFPRDQIFIFRNEDYRKDKKYSLFKLFEFLEVGDISTRLVDTIVNLPKAYETKLKATQGSMLNETWEILNEFFEEPNRKLAEMLNDDRYLWKDTGFSYKPKASYGPRSASSKNASLSKTNTLKRYYERKKASKLNPNSEIDQLIKVSKNFEEWFAMVKKRQVERTRSGVSNVKKSKVPYQQKKQETKELSLKKYKLDPKINNSEIHNYLKKMVKFKSMEPVNIVRRDAGSQRSRSHLTSNHRALGKKGKRRKTQKS